MFPGGILNEQGIVSHSQSCCRCCQVTGIPNHNGVEDERERGRSTELGLIASVGKAPLAAKEDRSRHRVLLLDRVDNSNSLFRAVIVCMWPQFGKELAPVSSK